MSELDKMRMEVWSSVLHATLRSGAAFETARSYAKQALEDFDQLIK